MVGEPDAVYPVKALLGVLADEDVPEAEIDAFVAGYVVPAGDEDEGGRGGPRNTRSSTRRNGQLRYARRGEDGEAVILVHGFGGDLDNWLFNIDALAARASVHALDLPGHGQSDKAVKEADARRSLPGALGFMEALGIDAAHLVGHSMGGAVALRTALDPPKRVKSLLD